MSNYLKQCILISKLIILLIVSGCMAPVYEYTSDIIDRYFEQKQIKRICSSLYLELYRTRKELSKLGKKIKIKSSQDDLKAQQAVDEFIQKIIAKTDTLEDLDHLGKVLGNHGAIDFESCTESTLNSCIEVVRGKKNPCHEKYTQLNFLYYYKSSDFFTFMKSNQKEEIEKRIKELENR